MKQIFNAVSGWFDLVLDSVDVVDIIDTQKDIPNWLATLDNDGKIPISQVPSSIVSPLVWKGFWDASWGVYPASPEDWWSYWINVAGTISGVEYEIGDWIVFETPNWGKIDNTDQVVSVAGKKGAVTLVKWDVGLWNVDNTSDADKPISNATQTALNLKADLAFFKSTGRLYYVDGSTGSDTLNDGKSIWRPFATIQKAIDTASANDAIQVQSWAYTENLTIGNGKSRYIVLGDWISNSVRITGTLDITNTAAIYTVIAWGSISGLVSMVQGGLRFHNCKLSWGISVTGNIDNNIDFNDCYIIGAVSINYTLTGINGVITFTWCWMSTALITINWTSVVLCDKCSYLGKITHTAGAIAIVDCTGIVKDGSSICISSTANVSATNFISVSNTSLMQPDLSFGVINKTWTCFYQFSRVVRSGADVLTGTRVMYDLANDIFANRTAVNYTPTDTSIKGHLDWIDTAIGNSTSKIYPFVTVWATWADYTSLNLAIDYVSSLWGWTIMFTDDLYTYATWWAAKNVSNITFVWKSWDWNWVWTLIFWNSWVWAWTGYNVSFKNIIVRGRPWSSGSLLTLTVPTHINIDNCQFIIDGSTSPSLATSIINCNSQICRIYCNNTIMTKSAPWNRTTFTNDTNATIFAFNKTNLSVVTPTIVNIDSSSIVQWWTPTTTNRIDKASWVLNDSSMTWVTIKDVLNGIFWNAINSDLVPDTTNTRNLWSNLNGFAALYLAWEDWFVYQLDVDATGALRATKQ